MRPTERVPLFACATAAGFSELSTCATAKSRAGGRLKAEAAASQQFAVTAATPTID
jgi:hypothetical protein